MKRLAGVLMALLVCAAMAAAAETGTSATAVAPKAETSTVEVGGSVHRARVRLAVGDTLRMVLGSGSHAGGRWSVAGNSGILTAEKEVSRPGRQIFPFAAAKPGSARLLFTRERRREGVATEQVRTLQITVVARGAASQADVRPRGRLAARFTGKIPCADCSGIEETIAFYTARRDAGGGVYVDRMQYIGRGFTYVATGRWREGQGTVGSPGMIYSLRGNDPSSQWRNYRVDRRLLIPLDKDGKPIQSPFNLSLHQIE